MLLNESRLPFPTNLADSFGHIATSASALSTPFFLSIIAIAPQGRSWQEVNVQTTKSVFGICLPSITPPGEAVLFP